MKINTGDVVINYLGENGELYNQGFTPGRSYTVTAGTGDICGQTGKQITMTSCCNIVDDEGNTRLIIVGDASCSQFFAKV